MLRNSRFEHISGHVLKLDKETDDIGIYNVENVVVDNCVFADVEGVAIGLHRGGRDESTFGPILDLNHSTFHNVGKGKRNALKAAVSLHGVQLANIHNSVFSDSRPLALHLTVGEPVTNIGYCNFYKSAVTANDPAYNQYSSLRFQPDFGSDYQLETSDQTGEDGKKLGAIW